MNAKALHTLEFYKITQMLAARAVSPMGKKMAAELVPMKDLTDITIAQRETTAAAGFILRKGTLPLGGIADIRKSIARAVAGGMLYIEDLLQVCDFLYVCGKVITYGNEKGEATCLAPYFDGVMTADAVEREIGRCIKNATEIADSASPKLADIRRNIRVSHDKIRDQLQSVIRSEAYKNMLQDPIVTLRGDRFCVPVKAEHRGAFPGMVHDQSASGATLFMEPLSVVQQNNKIKELHFEEKREEERILMKLSTLVADEGELLSANTRQLTHLDFVFAKGELALAMKATEPVFNNQGYVHIRKGRHPLLNADRVVPTDIYLGRDFTLLLITGPNTGGKTVTLKTIGLFTCMGQAGLHIPAFDNSALSVFDEVFADIGDEQSIEQSLSTFSSHMSNIVGILGQIGTGMNALVLLDELGAGTDPTEGAALAIAILQYLKSHGIPTVITTHYSELKLYALSTPGVENASCEFDVETLRPTYRLLIGIPGKSNAFAIAQRLGLQEDIIDDARNVLSQKDARFEDLITDLEAGKKQAILEQERAESYRREAETLRAETERQKEKLTTQREKILATARAEAQETLRKAKLDAEALLSEMRRSISTAKDLEAARQSVRDTLGTMEAEMEAALGKAEKPHRTPPANLRKGDRVHIHSFNQDGTVLVVPNAAGEVLVQAGIMQMKVPLADLSLAPESPEKDFGRFGTAGHSGSRMTKSLHISPEMDLRGMTPEEAVEKADKYLDDAFLASLSTVTLIHGKGTGAVRAAIHAQLKRHPHVKEYRLGKYGEGETGVTVVTLK
ncbi:MAG: endonuclease MutS2 [Defluviitaleaceae bacterium]|nr:endonuclease MutS2 [Defluviitaleaceae bacterium]MCL2240122.1 endonuclease MutS2 [Defluviitaleaceae bacterium]